jgi:hypothetical protein
MKQARMDAAAVQAAVQEQELGPNIPDCLIRIRVHEFVLQFRSGSIHKATWEISTYDDASCFNITSLKVLSYYDTDHSLSTDYSYYDTDHSLSTDYTFYALAKMPNQCRYLVLCENRHDCGAFLLHGDSNTSLKISSGLVTSLAKDCYNIFKRSRTDVSCKNNVCYIEQPVTIGHSTVREKNTTRCSLREFI